jgi:hypothetical protein
MPPGRSTSFMMVMMPIYVQMRMFVILQRMGVVMKVLLAKQQKYRENEQDCSNYVLQS